MRFINALKPEIIFYLIPCLFLIGCSQPNDAEAIKRLLEKESATWRSGDIAAHASCWSIRPYSRILVSLPDGTALDIPPSMMIAPPKNSVGHGGSSTNSDYKMYIHENDAWVSHQELSVAKDGSKSYSYEMRILEKVNGEWKLTGQSIHVYHPK
jgi:hypothetical protein